MPKENEEIICSKLKKGDDNAPLQNFTLIIFGGAGDLSSRMLIPTLFHLFNDDLLPEKFSVIGAGRRDLNDEGFQKHCVTSIETYYKDFYESEVLNKFLQRIFFFQIDSKDTSQYSLLSNKIKEKTTPDENGKKNIIYYLSVPPSATSSIVSNLGPQLLDDDSYNTKIIIEKPFGRDTKSAEELTTILHDSFSENQIYRIDHYLGKETVQNVIFFRFANSILEPLWNRNYIDNVQITVAEDIGIEHRGNFYEQSGIIRDIIQNHMMQLIALIAMEAPVGFDADYIRDEKVKIYNSMREMNRSMLLQNIVLGQYDKGIVDKKKIQPYREEKDVSPQSTVPTFFGGKFFIDNWRWSGVPFYVRAGKRLKKRITEICIEFKHPPLRLFGDTCSRYDPNLLFITIQPENKIAFNIGIKYPNKINEIQPVQMKFNYEDFFGPTHHPPYERLLMDCIKGDLSLYAREDGIKSMWHIVDPIIKYYEENRPIDFPNYKAGSWGPDAAEDLLKNDGRKWHTT